MLQKVRKELQRRCSPREVEGVGLDLVTYADHMLGDLVLRLRAEIFAEHPPGKEQVIEHPTTWLDAVKQRWVPGWAVKRWPKLQARMTRHVITPQILYPGLKASVPDTCHVMKVAVRKEYVPEFVDRTEWVDGIRL